MISVSIPFFNYGQYIDECVDSILAQTYQDFELIIVNDASTDPDSIKKVSDQLKKSSKVRLVTNKENLGCAASRNIGFEHASTDLVVSFDADNIMLPNFLAKHLEYYNKESRPLISCQFEWFDGKSFVDTKPLPCTLATLYYTNWIDCCVLLSKELWASAGKFKPELRGLYEDWELWLTLAEQGHEVFFIPEVLFKYRWHKGCSSLVNKDKRKQHFEIIKQKHPNFDVEKALKEKESD